MHRAISTESRGRRGDRCVVCPQVRRDGFPLGDGHGVCHVPHHAPVERSQDVRGRHTMQSFYPRNLRIVRFVAAGATLLEHLFTGGSRHE